MILDDIHELLELDNLYIGELPQKVENCISMVSTVSPQPSSSIGYYEQHVDFWARFRKTDEGYSALQSIFDFLHRKVAYETDNHYIYVSLATGLIDDMDRDEEGRKMLRLGFRFIYRNL